MAELKLSTEIISSIEKICDDIINNFEVIVHNDNPGSLGNLGEMIFVTLKNKGTKQNFDLAIKQALPANNSSTEDIIKHLYYNETTFYDNIWKKMEAFQNSYPDVKTFEIVPKYYGSNLDGAKGIIIMENLKVLGFETLPKNVTFDGNHIELLLKLFGQFHGVVASFREYNPDEYQKFTIGLQNAIFSIHDTHFFQLFNFEYFKQTFNMSKDEKIKEKLKVYIDNFVEIARNSIKYNGKNPVICHADCWSSNMMFKYDNDGVPTDVRLLDFQFCLSGSVVLDLSYIFYSGGTKDIFAKFDYYLRIYYNTFADTLRSFRLNPSEIFTFENLKKEWKEHCAYGFIMGTLLWRNKLSKSSETVVEIIVNRKFYKNDTTNIQQIMDIFQIDEVKLEEVCVDIVQHLYEYDFL